MPSPKRRAATPQRGPTRPGRSASPGKKGGKVSKTLKVLKTALGAIKYKGKASATAFSIFANEQGSLELKTSRPNHWQSKLEKEWRNTPTKVRRKYERLAAEANKEDELQHPIDPTDATIPSLWETGGMTVLLLLIMLVIHSNRTITIERQLRAFGFVFCVFILSLLDTLFFRFSRGRWLLLHTVGNFIISVSAFSDTLATFKDPVRSLEGRPSSLSPTFMVPAIHVYHMLMFKCSRADYVHHLLFAGIICPLGFIYEIGTLQNCVAFFICGLPGCIDYAMLACVKSKFISSVTEKCWNARINVWMRSPGLLFCTFCCFYATPPAGFQKLTFVLVGILCLLNGQYYMQVVVGNTFVRSREFGSVYNS